jgi:hypothetical protein
MSFRQFPAVDSNGESHIIIEFKPEANGSGHHLKPRRVTSWMTGVIWFATAASSPPAAASCG